MIEKVSEADILRELIASIADQLRPKTAPSRRVHGRGQERRVRQHDLPARSLAETPSYQRLGASQRRYLATFQDRLNIRRKCQCGQIHYRILPFRRPAAGDRLADANEADAAIRIMKPFEYLTDPLYAAG